MKKLLIKLLNALTKEKPKKEKIKDLSEDLKKEDKFRILYR